MLATTRLRQALRIGPPGDIWHKPAISAVVTLATLNLTLLAAGRLDLALYTSTGGLVALYGHGLPYRARVRTLAAVLLGTVASTGIALTAAALTTDAAVLVALTAVLAALHKLLCDAARIGPPGNLIITFTTASCAFVPQHLTDVPAHLALTALGAALAWLVCMAPALPRPYGPERITTARALEAAARLRRTDPAHAPAARAALAGAIHAARHSLVLSSPARLRSTGDALERLLVRAEAALAGPGDAATAGQYAGWAHDLRRNRPLPVLELGPSESDELRGRKHDGPSTIRQGVRPGSALLPVGLRVLVGCAAAGWVSMALGVGRPSWAVVTAASVFQANSTMSWQRALQRVLGNLLGLLVFTALLPVSHAGPTALIALGLLCQFGAEATITRSYWLASVFVTPMALLMTEFAGYHPARTLVADRWLDTCVGAAAGLAACLLVTNRRTATRLDRALTDATAATEHARTTRDAATARLRLSAALLELREAADTAAGEWRQRPLPHSRVSDAEQRGHRLLADLVGQRSGHRHRSDAA